ncbi:MAG: hypothetical protein OK474_08050 [Thaumarchaeota archaeon]|nr:hypothetical protein [Nitrososphaerota archaeon]
MKPIQIVLATFLAASALVGIEILSSDEWLWYVAPTHAYGLILFVLLDSALAVALWRTTRLAAIGSALFGAVQFAAMFGDIIMGQPAGVPIGLWRSYLLSDTAFTLLLCIQLIIVASAILASRTSVGMPQRRI